MPLALHLAEEVKSTFPGKLYSEVFQTTLAVSRFQTENGFRLSGKKVTLNAVAVSEQKIRELNRQYRRKDSVTDILSFGEEKLAAHEGEVFLGELFFSPRFIRKQAAEDGRPYRQSMIYIFSHGILHLLGYDHGKKMFAYQDQVTEKLERAQPLSKKKIKKKKYREL